MIPEKPANDDVKPADRPALAKPFAVTGQPFPVAAGIAPNEDDGPLVIYSTLSGCSPS